MANGYKLKGVEPLDDEDQPSLVERVFPNPDTVNQGEYLTIYEFLQNPDITGLLHNEHFEPELYAVRFLTIWPGRT